MSMIVPRDCCVFELRVIVYEQWEIDHGPQSVWQLIEPVDGFHPNQVCTSV